MKQRVITAVILIACCLPCILVGGILFDMLTLAAILIAAHELMTTVKAQYHIFLKGIIYALFIGGWAIATFASIRGMLGYIGFALLVMFTLVVVTKQAEMDHIGLYYLILIDVMATIYVLERIDDMSPRIAYLMLLLVGTYLTDSTALIVGKQFGKHKLNERISPNKTIEGAVGAYISTTVVLFAYIWFLKLPMDAFNILCCILFGYVGQIGDLAFSAIKRRWQIKDFGTVFPGHGGVLDRIDSLTFNCILMFILMVIFK